MGPSYVSSITDPDRGMTLTMPDLFDSEGRMLTAIRPPDAIIPMRNGSQSFSAASPPHYINNGEGPLPVPEDPDTGRDNNSGFEGMHVSDDGRTLWVMLQSAAVQEGVSRPPRFYSLLLSLSQ